MLAVAFWLCCILLVYVYALYPVLVKVLAARMGTAPQTSGALPTVTVIVTAYNEEDCIAAKLENLLGLDYPAERLKVLVVSDGSTDRTEEISARFAPGRVSVLRVEGRRGKTACQNAAAAASTSEVLVFTDATTRLQGPCVRRLVENFGDSHVGCVGGRLIYVSDVENLTGVNGEAYWSYEVRLRVAESLLGSMIGVSGCLYAVRRSTYRAIDPELISDFVIAMKMREQGLRTVLATEAICYESTLACVKDELRMRVRVAVRSLNALIHERRFLNPVRYGVFAWQLWSHKVLRYASPLIWLAALATNLLLARDPLYLALLGGQCALIGAGVAGFLLQGRSNTLGLFGRPYYFLLTNVASLIATMRYLRGERMVTWQPIRELGTPQA
ncbi:MAG: glycosyltransferase family 2 protein [Proteobacteria bacterium]|nr:glycosyltransferase family 2 protein [Pseudomonadota bacterium]